MTWKERELCTITKLEMAMKRGEDDPYWILRNFSAFPFNYISPAAATAASEFICHELDKVPNFENLDIIFQRDGILKVCPQNKGIPLAIVNMKEHTVAIARLKEMPDANTDKIRKEIEDVNRKIESQKKSFFSINFVDMEILRLQKEALEASLSVKEKEEEVRKKEAAVIKAEIAKIRELITPVFERCGYTFF